MQFSFQKCFLAGGNKKEVCSTLHSYVCYSFTWEKWAPAPLLLSLTCVSSACLWVCSLWSQIHLWKFLPFWVKWEIHISPIFSPKNHTPLSLPLSLYIYIYTCICTHTNLLPSYIKSAFPPTCLDLCHRSLYFCKTKLLLWSRVVRSLSVLMFLYFIFPTTENWTIYRNTWHLFSLNFVLYVWLCISNQ